MSNKLEGKKLFHIYSVKQYHFDLKKNEPSVLVETRIKRKCKVSLAESAFSRMLGISTKTDDVCEDVIIVNIAAKKNYQMLGYLIRKGFTFRGCPYRLLTASAGQIRNVKTIFIKEEIYQSREQDLLCGLKEETFNYDKAICVNKYFAYLALLLTSTTKIEDFDIDKVVVVDDLETIVTGKVDTVDYDSYKILPGEVSVKINHTDGCGMWLPNGKRKTAQFRMPWVKGLMVPFDFVQFIKGADEKDSSKEHEIIKDIYGTERRIITEGIEVILSKSQFKMHSCYKNWEAYTEAFKKHGGEAGYLSEEPKYIRNAKIGYQALQPLTDATDDELKTLVKPTLDMIKDIDSDVVKMMAAFGITDRADNLNGFQECVKRYPPLINDPYTKKALKDAIISEYEQACSGRIQVDGKYTFIIPDMYAHCQRLFLGDENPSGLLGNGEVSCNLYPDGERLDCIRFPVLHRDHALRMNCVSDDHKKWFVTKGVYLSIHDLISRILQSDCDGDQAVVCIDSTLLQIAERNMQGVMPLYYKPHDPVKKKLNVNAKVTGLRAGFKGSKIGETSNPITRALNKTPVDWDVIKLLCMENNLKTDYAKNMFMSTRTPEAEKNIKESTSGALPYFMRYAKGKVIKKNKKDENRKVITKHVRYQDENGEWVEKDQKQKITVKWRPKTEPINDSTVNRITKMTKEAMPFLLEDKNGFVKFPPYFKFTVPGKFDYSLLMHTPDTIPTQEFIDKYKLLARTYGDDMGERNEEETRFYAAVAYVRNELISVAGGLIVAADMAVKYKFTCTENHSNKKMLWDSFEWTILDALRKNLKRKYCTRCGADFEPNSNRQLYCSKCQKRIEAENDLAKKRKKRAISKVGTCA